jgi:Tol biopolymer transport system component
MLWGSIVALLAVAFAVLLVRGRASTTPVQLLRAAVPAPDSADGAFTQGIALSPDGEWLAFTALRNGRQSLWLRRLDESEARPLDGTDDASYPFWSADGAAVGFFADRKLKLIARSGGLARTLCDAPFGRGGAWSRSGVILFAPRDGPLYRVASEGGDCAPATTLDAARRESWHVAPHFLPDGNHFLFTVRGEGPWTIRVGSLESKDTRIVLTGSERAEYAAGYLLFERERALFAQRFDLRSLSVSGEPVAIGPIVNPGGWPTFSASTERLAFHPGGESQSSQLTWIDRADRVLGVVPGSLNFWTFRLSPDGGRIAGNNGTTSGALSVGEIDRGTTVVFTQPTRRGTPDLRPVWSPDGNQIVFQHVSTNDGIYTKTLGRQDESALLKLGEVSWPTDWSKDGRFVLFTRRTASSSDIWVYSLAEKKVSPVVTTGGNDDSGCFSPDGRWIAYVSDETGVSEVQVRPFPAAGPARRVSTAGGVAPKWRPDGRELFYVAPGGALVAVPVDQSNGELRFGTPTVLFRRPLIEGDRRVTPYDIAGSGADVRFLVNVKLGHPNPLELIVGWRRLLQHRAP